MCAHGWILPHATRLLAAGSTPDGDSGERPRWQPASAGSAALATPFGPPAHPERRQPECGLTPRPTASKSLALVEAPRARVRLVDVELDHARRAALGLVEERNGEARAALVRRDAELVEIARSRIDGDEARRPSPRVEADDDLGARRREAQRRRFSSQARRASKSIAKPVAVQAATQRSTSAGRSASAKSRNARVGALTAPSA